MKQLRLFIFIVLAIFAATSLATAEEASQKIKDLAEKKLAQYGNDPVIVKAVLAQNAQGKTLDQIKAVDKKWQSHAGIADYMKALLENECARHLRSIQNAAPYFSEIFVMDNLGANVAMTDKTSDYWQGDEAKFKKSFTAGAGAIFVDDVEFDDSTQAYLVQISVPVRNAGQVVGAITFGIDVDKVE
jgi:hypothetical protein